jgi:KipI family sensor histidine kinase inhibitor
MVRLLPYGRDALLAEYDTLDEVLAAAAAVRRLPGLDDAVPAARTLLVRWTGAEPPALRGVLAAPPPASSPPGEPVTIEVVYDGEDLVFVAASAGLSIEEVIDRHTAPEYTAAFCGFAPGFTYLAGLDPALHLPRRATPRIRVPQGAVAIAGEFSAVYPTASPGGWHLLGRSDALLFDLCRRPPALVEPGATVRFVAR